MKIKRFGLGVLLLASCGCSTMSNTDAGVLGGGVLGGVGGAAIGSAVGHPGAGAAIGALTGAAAGGLTGHAIDRAEARGEARAVAAVAAQQQAQPPLGLYDVVRLAQQHTPDAIIIQQMRSTGSYYNLTPDELIYLRQQGVSDVVVTEMQTRRPMAVQPVRPYARHVYVYEPPPPPVRVGIGFNYGYGPHCHRRCW